MKIQSGWTRYERLGFDVALICAALQLVAAVCTHLWLPYVSAASAWVVTAFWVQRSVWWRKLVDEMQRSTDNILRSLRSIHN